MAVDGTDGRALSSEPTNITSTVDTTPDDTADQQTPTDDAVKPYSSFSRSMKWTIVALCSIAGLFSPISTNIYAPAIPVLTDAFGVSAEKINLTVTVYLIFQALTPAFWGSLSDSYGRRPVYLATLVIYLCACIGLALTPTSAYWLLMLLRCIQATGGSAVIAIGAGCVSDIAAPHERGTFLGVFSAGNMFGPAIGPLLGGIFADTLGWRSIFWFLAILCGVCIVPMLLFFPETLRSLVGDGSIPPPALNCTPFVLAKRRRLEKLATEKAEVLSLKDRPQRKKFAPLDSFLILGNPDIAFLMIYTSFIYAEFYCVLTILSTVLKDRYGYSDIIIGVCYIPNGVGALFANIITGRFLDFFYRRERKRVGAELKDAPDEFQLEKARLMVLPVIVPVFHLACIGIGWALQSRANIAVTLVLNFFVGLAGASSFSVATVFAIDMMPNSGGAVTASFNLVRCLFGAVGTAVIQMIYHRMGAGWAFVLISGICFLATPLPLAIIRWGPGWRRARVARNLRAEEKRRIKTGAR